ncbi:MAG: hypothetical protein GX604_02845 [Actinobacteria bacterium]|nr:hypothetical protein [Actinomycetota bacterium]
MRYRLSISPTILLRALLAGLVFVLVGCGGNTVSTTATSVPESDPTASIAEFADSAFEEAWAASLAALEALGPTRVNIIGSIQGRVGGSGISPEQSEFGSETQEAEQLLDISGSRARLTVRSPDGTVETTVVIGKERMSTRSTKSSSQATSQFVTVDRYISLELPQDLPLPLWAGNAVGPTEGYADLFGGGASDVGHAGDVERVMLGGRVERQPDGGMKLTWEHGAKGIISTGTLWLGPDNLPARIETAIQGRPEEGELEGFDLEYAVTVEYTYQSLTAFSDSDFVLEIPENANLEIVVHELALDRPWAEQADWGRYWLGRQVGEWSLARAEHMIYKVNPGFGAQPHDEHISLIYRRSEATNPNETIQLTIEPLSDRPIEGPRDFAEQRVASGDWVCREMALAGRSATVYSGVLEGGANDHIDTFYIFLPDAFVNIQLWAPVDPQLVLESLSPVD